MKGDIKFFASQLVVSLLLSSLWSIQPATAQNEATVGRVDSAPVSGLVFDISSMSGSSGHTAGTAPAFTFTPRPARQRTLLQARIEHSEEMPPVDPHFRVGLTFDESKLPRLVPGNKWHWIPDWFAGHWVTETMTCYYVRDLQTGLESRTPHETMARGEEDIGFQKDRQGGIWEFEYQPYVTRTEGRTTFTVSLVREHEAVEVTPGRVVYRFLATQIKVDKWTRLIVSVDQVESLQTYTSPSRDIVRCVGSQKAFDANGRPVTLQRNVSAKLRTAGFEPINYYKEKDLRPLFRQFLLSQGRADLVPTSSPATIRRPTLKEELDTLLGIEPTSAPATTSAPVPKRQPAAARR